MSFAFLEGRTPCSQEADSCFTLFNSTLFAVLSLFLPPVPATGVSCPLPLSPSCPSHRRILSFPSCSLLSQPQASPVLSLFFPPVPATGVSCPFPLFPSCPSHRHLLSFPSFSLLSQPQAHPVLSLFFPPVPATGISCPFPLFPSCPSYRRLQPPRTWTLHASFILYSCTLSFLHPTKFSHGGQCHPLIICILQNVFAQHQPLFILPNRI